MIYVKKRHEREITVYTRHDLTNHNNKPTYFINRTYLSVNKIFNDISDNDIDEPIMYEFERPGRHKR